MEGGHARKGLDGWRNGVAEAEEKSDIIVTVSTFQARSEAIMEEWHGEGAMFQARLSQKRWGRERAKGETVTLCRCSSVGGTLAAAAKKRPRHDAQFTSQKRH